ncbi:MAG: hypothetical protein WDN08_13050 [Rhizomicrobium sp.]
MRETQELRAEPRAGKGKGPAYQNRLKGSVPGVVYGGDAAPENVSVDYRTLERHLPDRQLHHLARHARHRRQEDPRHPARSADRSGDRPSRACRFHAARRRRQVRLAIPVHFRNQGESPGLRRAAC